MTSRASAGAVSTARASTSLSRSSGTNVLRSPNVAARVIASGVTGRPAVTTASGLSSRSPSRFCSALSRIDRSSAEAACSSSMNTSRPAPPRPRTRPAASCSRSSSAPIGAVGGLGARGLIGAGVDVAGDLQPRDAELDGDPLQPRPPAPALVGVEAQLGTMQGPLDPAHQLGQERSVPRARDPDRHEAQLGRLPLRGAQQRGLAEAARGVEHQQRPAELAERRHPAHLVADPAQLGDPAGEDPGHLARRVGVGQRLRHAPSPGDRP